ncbi:hypothetical protein B4134_2670 [Bacillus safensis]|nr:hypothetical protein B4134_2670 [Bacillus safensis]
MFLFVKNKNRLFFLFFVIMFSCILAPAAGSYKIHLHNIEGTK